VKSKPKEGTTVVIKLPLRTKDQTSAQEGR